jgi:hypothetical protein
MLISLVTSNLEKEVIRHEQAKVGNNNEGYA